MKKLIKYMCVLAIAAIATIVIMYNMASADGEGESQAQPTFRADTNVEVKNGIATINVWFEFGNDIEKVTSASISVSASEGVTWTNQPEGGVFYDCGNAVKIPLTFDCSKLEGNEASVTFSIGNGSWNYKPVGSEDTIRGGDVSGITTTITKKTEEPDPVDPPEDNEFELEFSNISMNVGDSRDLPVINPQKEVTWSSENSEVAIVEGNKIVGKGEGETNLVATAGEGDNAVSKKVKVTVAKQNPDSGDNNEFELEFSNISMNVGDSKDLPVINPQKEVTWSSENSEVAIVEGNKIVGKGEGETNLVATAGEGDNAVSKKVKVTVAKQNSDPGETPNDPVVTPPDDPGETPSQPVVDNDPPTIKPDGTTKMYVGDVITYGADKDVTWSSSDNSIAIINKTTGKVTAVGEGKVTITATAKNGKEATAQIIVERKSDGGNEVADPVISPNSDFTINAGATYQLNADMEVEWISSDESVATVDANGLVKGVGGGKAFIYAKSKDLRVSSVGVTVKGAKSKGNKGSTGGSKTNKTGNAATEDGNSSSTVNEEVPSTGEATTGTIVILGAVTLIVAAVIFRKKMK